eukprot:195028-Prymnesium_polylepis.1
MARTGSTGQCRASSRVTSHMESATLRSGGARRGESPFIMALTLHAGQWAVGQGDAGAPAADPTRDRRNEYALTRKAREQNVPGGAPGSKEGSRGRLRWQCRRQKEGRKVGGQSPLGIPARLEPSTPG